MLQLLRRFINSMRDLIATITDQQMQDSTMERSREVLKHTIQLLLEAQRALRTPHEQNKCRNMSIR